MQKFHDFPFFAEVWQMWSALNLCEFAKHGGTQGTEHRTWGTQTSSCYTSLKNEWVTGNHDLFSPTSAV